jgi:hypothetical protein
MSFEQAKNALYVHTPIAVMGRYNQRHHNYHFAVRWYAVVSEADLRFYNDISYIQPCAYEFKKLQNNSMVSNTRS